MRISKSSILLPSTLMMALLLMGLRPLLGARAGVDSNRHNYSSAGDMLPVSILQRFIDALRAVDLNDEQKSRLQPILVKAQQDAENLQSHLYSMNGADRAAAIKQFIANVKDQVTPFLTDDQGQQIVQLMASDRRGGIEFARLKLALADLELSDTQQQEVDRILARIEPQLAQLRQQIAAGSNVQGQAEQIRLQLRRELGGVLTPGQIEKLQDKLQENHAAVATTRPQSLASTTRPGPPQSQNGHNGAPIAPAAPATVPVVGETAPDFSLVGLNNSTIKLAAFKGKVVVLEFGSLSSPAFRDRAAAMQKLQSDLGARVVVLVVYVREAHPIGDEIARNREDAISVAQSVTLADRRALATTARDRLKITLPIYFDTLDDAVSARYGGFANGAAVIDKNGKLVALQHWCDPGGLRPIIESAAAGK